MSERNFDVGTLHEIMKRLRDPATGCPWDSSRTLPDLAKTLIGEAEEAGEALRGNDAAHQCEELGDVLLNVMLAVVIAEEKGLFRWEDAVKGVCDKLVRRHPHVFGGQTASSPEEAMAMFLAAKAAEKGR